MNQNNKGFTLIELMLAMSFIAVLLLMIAMTVIQISNMYNRGLTLKEVNQAGRSLSSELTHSIAASAPFLVSGTETRYINPVNGPGGRLCLGQYSYIWNYGKSLAGGTPLSNKFSSGSTANIRFVRVPDSTGYYCTSVTPAPLPDVNPVGAVELLDVGDLDLAIHSFAITTAASASDARTHQSLYFVSFVIGTNEQVALNSNQSTCLPPSNLASDLNYCSVNQFDIVARAGNEVQ
ncbi:MAG: type II secretion system protein [Candidatus Saccharibacteria bacterium]